MEDSIEFNVTVTTLVVNNQETTLVVTPIVNTLGVSPTQLEIIENITKNTIDVILTENDVVLD